MQPFNDSDLTEAQRDDFWGRVDGRGVQLVSPRRREFLARLEAASRVVFGDRKLVTCASIVRHRIALRATLKAMRGGKGKLWTETADCAERYHNMDGEWGARLRASEIAAYSAADAAHAAPCQT